MRLKLLTPLPNKEIKKRRKVLKDFKMRKINVIYILHEGTEYAGEQEQIYVII